MLELPQAQPLVALDKGDDVLLGDQADSLALLMLGAGVPDRYRECRTYIMSLS